MATKDSPSSFWRAFLAALLAIAMPSSTANNGFGVPEDDTKMLLDIAKQNTKHDAQTRLSHGKRNGDVEVMAQARPVQVVEAEVEAEVADKNIAQIQFVVISSIDLPKRSAYQRATWLNKRHQDLDVVFYDEESPGVNCSTQFMGEEHKKRLKYQCAQQRLLYALRHIAQRTMLPEWTIIVDDDTYYNMERLARFLGALDHSLPIYAFEGGEWGNCVEVEAHIWLPNDWRSHQPFRAMSSSGADEKKKKKLLDKFLFPVWAVNGGAGHILSRGAVQAFQARYTPRPQLSMIDVCTQLVETNEAWQTSASDLTLPMCFGWATVGRKRLWKGLTTMNQVWCIHRAPYTVHHTPYTMHHTPYTMHRAPCTIHHTPYTMHRAPYTHTIHHTPYTIHHTPTPYTHHTPTIHPPYTQHTILYTIIYTDGINFLEGECAVRMLPEGQGGWYTIHIYK
jgi:hypothetical protein